MTLALALSASLNSPTEPWAEGKRFGVFRM